MKMTMKNTLRNAAFLALIAAPGAAFAADGAQAIGTFGAWTSYVFTENGAKVCYMASQPTKHEGKYGSRGQIFALVTSRPAENDKDVFSYIAGYDYKPGSDVTVTIDSDTYTLFTQNDTAWAPDGATDSKIAEGLRKGSKMVVKGTSARGTATTDTFSLKGTGSAHDAINKECGL